MDSRVISLVVASLLLLIGDAPLPTAHGAHVHTNKHSNHAGDATMSSLRGGQTSPSPSHHRLEASELKAPILLLPGLCASQLEAIRRTPTAFSGNQLSRARTLHAACQSDFGFDKLTFSEGDITDLETSNFHPKASFRVGPKNLWLPSGVFGLMQLLRPSSKQCFLALHGMSLEKSGYMDKPGLSVSPVSTRHGMDGVECLHDTFCSISYLYKPISDSLVSNHGYTVGKDLIAVPYDWRRPPNDNNVCSNFFSAIRQLKANTRKPVTVVVHSMGGLVAHFCLTQPSPKARTLGGYSSLKQAKKDIHRLIAFATPWSGAPVATKTLVSGHSFVPAGLDAMDFRKLARSLGSVHWITPNGVDLEDDKKHWTMNFANGTSVSYSRSEVTEIFRDVFGESHDQSKRMEFGDGVGFRSSLEDPRVPVTCVSPYGQQTASRITFDEVPSVAPGAPLTNALSSINPTIGYDDGDGLVPKWSSSYLCQKLLQDGVESVELQFMKRTMWDYEPMYHRSMLNDARAVELIMEAVDPKIHHHHHLQNARKEDVELFHCTSVTDEEKVRAKRELSHDGSVELGEAVTELRNSGVFSQPQSPRHGDENDNSNVEIDDDNDTIVGALWNLVEGVWLAAVPG